MKCSRQGIPLTDSLIRLLTRQDKRYPFLVVDAQDPGAPLLRPLPVPHNDSREKCSRKDCAAALEMFHKGILLPEFCTRYRIEALKPLCLKCSWSDFDPQA